MAQCVGRSQRTGERCGRSAASGASTCYYHSAAAAPPRVDAPRPSSPSLTTKLLSKRTWDDFEALFAVGTGWGRCGCLFALDARRSTRGGTWAEQRETNLDTMRGLVARGRSHGILVYDHGAPMGWCQFVPKDELRFADQTSSGADWFITCFVVDPRYRGLGATSVALRGAVAAIGRKGGGVVEGRATAMAPGPPPKADRKDLYVDDDVLFWGGSAKVRYGVEIDGVGPVAALYRSRRSMHGAPLGGTVDLFRREGFEAVEVLPRPKSALADRVVMRRTV
jgi:ribosomal protein S18 acetylase RimI-like enzyme